MSAAKSQKNSGIPADLQPFYDEPRTTTRAWARWIARLVILVIVAVLLFMFVRWVWHQTHTDSHKPASSTTQKATSDTHSSQPITLGGLSDSDTSNTQDTSSTGDSSSNTATSGGNSASATQSVGQSSVLTDTGPGQTIGIFVASSLLFTLLYQLRLRTKMN